MAIETYNPAEVTFPENVSKILIVNNAVPQPEDAGYEYVSQGEKQDTCEAKADSALFDACRALGEAIVNASYFDDVLLYHHAVRKDHSFQSDKRLTSRQVKELCDETGTDAIISIDRLLFGMKKDVETLFEGYSIGTVNVRIAGVIRGYIPGREAPLATIHITDSVYWTESVDYMPILEKILPSPEEALRTAGEYIGAKAYRNFVPHWEKETRWYFTGIGSRWKEASVYAMNEKWDLAEEKWLKLYSSAKNEKKQAKAASNLALCHEMKGELEDAYEWANKSYGLFKRDTNDNAKLANMLELYVQVLAERIRSDAKLNVQFDAN